MGNLRVPAFAGYRYVTSRTTENIRNQFLNPKQKLFIPLSEPAETDEKFIVYIKKYDIFIVYFDGEKWLLPGVHSTDDNKVKFIGRRIEWPNKLIAYFDTLSNLQNF